MRFASLAALLFVTPSCSESQSEPDSEVFPQSPRPSKRSDISGAIEPASGQLAIFGGDDGPIVNQRPQARYLEDTWVLDPETGWSEASGQGPSARGRHASVSSADGAMFVFGGRFRNTGESGDYTLYNDLWSFDFSAQSWTLVDDGTSVAPSPRYFASMAYDTASQTLYVYGGGTNSDALALSSSSELWAFKDNAWSEVPTTGNAPSSRLFVASAHDTQANRLLVFGGQVGDFVSPAFADLYALDLDTGVWSLQNDGESSDAPQGRFSAMLSYDASQDRVLLTGGHADAGVTNDLWSYTPNEGWANLARGDAFTGEALGCLENPREIPNGYVVEDLEAPERRSGGFAGVYDGGLWVFGGESDCSDHLDDLWRFDLGASRWNEQIAARSGESCARQGNACTCLCL